MTAPPGDGADQERNETAEKRVCLFTGAGGRLGTAFCRLYASRYHIAAVYRTRPPLVASQSQRVIDPLRPTARLGENDHPVFMIQADLTRPGQIQGVVDAVLARLGALDLVVSAAAHSVWAPMLGPGRLLASAESQFRTNVLVPLELGLVAASSFWGDRAPENRARNRSIVNVSSIAGVNVYRGTGQSVYAASKAALNHLTRHMAQEFSEIGVRVNAVAPNSFPRIVATETVARAIVDLDQGTVTGGILTLDAVPTTS